MSVIVKGLEMPKICGQCQIKLGIDCELWKHVRSVSLDRHKDCPLAPVPPHGRLIDADKLEDKCSRQARDGWNKSTNTTNWGYAYTIFKSDIEDAPTIIPAEEE